MAKKYPAIGCKKAPRNAGGLPCIICGVPTTGKVDIETNWFRGDDEQVRVCKTHQMKHDAEILVAYETANAKAVGLDAAGGQSRTSDGLCPGASSEKEQ